MSQTDTLTVDEAAERMGINRNSAYEAARRGEIPTLRIGRRILVLRRPFERMLGGDGDSGVNGAEAE